MFDDVFDGFPDVLEFRIELHANFDSIQEESRDTIDNPRHNSTRKVNQRVHLFIKLT